jgi:5-methylcytosine-specific restriction endonuclease McrA
MRNARNRIYHRIMSSYAWRRLRESYLSSHPLCERCEAQDRTRLATEVHHRIPVETMSTEDGMRRLAFDRSNLMALCHECHAAIHEESERKGTREANRSNKAAAATDFLHKWTGVAPGTPGA